MTADLDDALNEAVAKQFIHLFDVLVKETTDKDKALEEFKAGLMHLAEIEHAVAEMLADKGVDE